MPSLKVGDSIIVDWDGSVKATIGNIDNGKFFIYRNIKGAKKEEDELIVDKDELSDMFIRKVVESLDALFNHEISYDEIIQLDEYKDILKLGFDDVSSNIQKKHTNIMFAYKKDNQNWDSTLEVFVKKYKSYSKDEIKKRCIIDGYFLIGLSITKSGYIRKFPIKANGFMDRAQVNDKIDYQRVTENDWIAGFLKLKEIAHAMIDKYKLDS